MTRTTELSGGVLDRRRAEIVDDISRALWEICIVTRGRGDPARGYIIVETALAEGELYVQLLADAGYAELVWECSSGFYGHPFIHRTTLEQRRALAARGFSDGSTGNHSKDVAISDVASAEHVADETMDILERVMGWSPAARLTLKVVHDR